jgi:hypothetical protein
MAADTYSAILGLLEQGTGNNNNTWGALLNTGVMDKVDLAVAGYVTTAVTGGTLDLSASPPPAGPSGAIQAILAYTGILASNEIVKVPNLSKIWLVNNQCTGAFTLTFKTPAGAASAAIPQGGWSTVWCDGANNISVGISTGQILAPDGTVNAPGYSFGAETNSGPYRKSSQVIGIAINGVEIFEINATGVNVTSGTLNVGGASVFLNWVAGGGTADAITATYSPAVPSLTDGLLCAVRATASNATTTPTFAPNGLTAHTVTKFGGSALLVGDIPANLAEFWLRYNLANTRWELINPAASKLASSQIPYGAVMLNGTIVQSQGGGAQTFAIKTLASADPSTSDPVTFLFRDVTAATGDYLVRSVTAALSITIPSGQAMGFSNSTPARIWIGALDNAGTVELFVVNALTGTSTYPLQGWGIITTSAVSGAALSGVAYSANVRTNKAYITIGYATWEVGGTLATAGTWNALATRMQLFQPGSTPLPGMEIQRQRTATGAVATGTTVFNPADTVPQNTAGDQYMTQAITPTSSANVLEIETNAFVSNGGTADRIGIGMFQDAVANALISSQIDTAAAVNMIQIRLVHEMLAATVSSTTFKIRMGTRGANTITFNGASSARLLGGNANSFIRAREIMA